MWIPVGNCLQGWADLVILSAAGDVGLDGFHIPDAALDN